MYLVGHAWQIFNAFTNIYFFNSPKWLSHFVSTFFLRGCCSIVIILLASGQNCFSFVTCLPANILLRSWYRKMTRVQHSYSRSTTHLKIALNVWRTLLSTLLSQCYLFTLTTRKVLAWGDSPSNCYAGAGQDNFHEVAVARNHFLPCSMVSWKT